MDLRSGSWLTTGMAGECILRARVGMIIVRNFIDLGGRDWENGSYSRGIFADPVIRLMQ